MEGATAMSLVGNVGQLLGEEYQRLSRVGGDVAELRNDLATMNALLHMLSESDDRAVDHFIREWMKQVRELAYDAEDCVDHYKLRMRPPSRGHMRAWLKHMFGTLFLRHRLAGEIRALRDRAVAISERHARYGIYRDALHRSPWLSATTTPMLSASVSGHAPLNNSNNPIGIDGQVNTITRGMEAVVDGDRDVKVFSIVGFGGLGKTTLAMQVCRRLEPVFPCQAMVAVSQAFEPGRDVLVLLKRLLHQVVKPKLKNEQDAKEEGGLGKIDGLDEKDLVDMLKGILNDKRYLILIDDVWTIRAWEAIQSVIPDNKCDSRIMVTTRIENVARACSPATIGGHYIHHMQPLKFEDSKKLFLSKAFGSTDADFPKELECVMSEILEKCAGLPLAIVSLASILAGYRSSGSKHKWETICRSIGSQMDSKPTLEGMKHIVTLSYNHLPYMVKGCMMYLSIFPEDYEVKKDRLLCRWIAEGLIPEKRGLTLMEVAESYLDEMVNRSMIEVRFCPDEYWKVESCQVHDMLLEVMVSKALECNFVSFLGGQYEAAVSCDRVRRLSIQGTNEWRSQSKEQPKKSMAAGRSIEEMDVEHVRSLSIFKHVEQKLLDHLDKFTLLRVLDLEGCEDLNNNHMRQICRLYLLRFLSLRSTNISKVPPEISKLTHLQTFDLWLSEVMDLPETVTRLGKLERLHLRNKTNWKRMWSLPRGVRKMRALRELGMVVLEDDAQIAQDLGELENLEDIKLFLNNEKIINGNFNVVQELAKSVSKLYSLRRLIIEDHPGFEHCRSNYKILNFLHDLSSPPRLLRCLKISGQIDCIPKWVRSLTYLVEFRLCYGRLVDDQLFGVLCKLPNLKCIQVEWECYSGHTLVARTSHNFPSLTKLNVICGAANPKVFKFEAGSMPKLEIVHINFGDNRERCIVGIQYLTQLKEVQLAGQKNNTAIDRALDLLKAENLRRHNEPESNQFEVSVQYGSI